ncbi:MAG: signal peptide peptidase SppA [Prevotellaceae bacterium]|jgi:protease-4|nr:signal peptide peptidase SppA [Prevotellaceae bacterium]
MKNFLKMLLASILGILIVNILVFIILLSAIAVIGSDEPVIVKNNSILKIALNKPLEDRAGVPEIDIINLDVNTNLGLNNILNGIERAESDHRIKGIYLELSNVQAGIASVEEIRDALLNFKESGKFILAYAENYSQKAYYLATVADKIYLNPFGGGINFTGISSKITFFKGFLDKLGVDMQIIRHGKFKSAVEPFILNKMSDENREQVKSYTGSIWNYILQTISASRDIEIEELNRIADNLELVTAEDALDKKFVDKLFYEDELIAELTKYSGVTSLNTIDITKYNTTSMLFSGGKDKIAVIYASGEIMSGEGDTEIMSKNLIGAISKARKDSTVKAVVFRVNSPGGASDASEFIARELEITKAKKPVVISMGDLAASGGYWISTPADKIFAHHTTLTGSIGVFGLIPNIEKTMKEKLGITFDVVRTNEYSDFPSITRPLKQVEKDYLQKMVEIVYSKFTDKVAKSRNLSLERVDSIGQGRVWSGANAFDIGLIDYFGGLKDAIREAAKLADISDYSILELPKELSTFEMLMKTFETKVSKSSGNEFRRSLEHYQYLINSIKNFGIVAKLPYEIEIE